MDTEINLYELALDLVIKTLLSVDPPIQISLEDIKITALQLAQKIKDNPTDKTRDWAIVKLEEDIWEP